MSDGAMFPCVCMYEYEDNGPQCVRREDRVARKRHVCCECRGEIAPGRKYQYVRGMWDGHWSTYRTCAPCAQIREDFMSCGYAYGCLWGDLRDVLGYADGGEDEEWLRCDARTVFDT